MAFIVEQAGGKGTDGFGRIMELLRNYMKES
jgi:fructose-1,6-bisphosphatase